VTPEDEVAYLRAALATEASDIQHYIATKRSGVDRYRAVCACGQYRSKTYFYPGLAEVAGWDHAAAYGIRRTN
jgi:hypothetical protein